MPLESRPRNRGPAAAADNRAALLSAARAQFAAHGYRVPLSAIARAAGVGQGVLYRHFPSRLELAYAVFGDNFAELEAMPADSPGAFFQLWRRVVQFSTESSAFVDLVLDEHRDVPDRVSAARLERLLAEPLRCAQVAGLADSSWTVDDLVLVLHMVHGVVSAHRGSPEVEMPVTRALGLIDPRLAG